MLVVVLPPRQMGLTQITQIFPITPILGGLRRPIPQIPSGRRPRLTFCKPTTSIFEAGFVQQTKDPHEPATVGPQGASLRLIVGLHIPKGLRPKYLASNVIRA
jgi:hypothetical protein